MTTSQHRVQRETPIIRCDSATVYDNSGLKGPRIVAQVNDGFLIGSPAWPAWTPGALRSACRTSASLACETLIAMYYQFVLQLRACLRCRSVS